MFNLEIERLMKMKSIINLNSLKAVLFFFILCGFLSSPLSLTGAAIEENGILSPGYGYSDDYYRGYGEPNISISVIGNTEFERGEKATLQVNLVNRGIPYGFSPSKRLSAAKQDQHLISVKELDYESRKTIAVGLKTSLYSKSNYVEIDSDSRTHSIEKLVPGERLEDPLEFGIKISNNAPAGEYILELPISYQYQSSARMTNRNIDLLGLPELDHTTHYNNVEKTIHVPIVIKKTPKFEITEVTSFQDLVPGSSQKLNVTYKNIGEKTAYDSVLRKIAIVPLSTNRATTYIGTMEPGQEKTVTFDIEADSDALEKLYAINSEIRYLDEDDELKFSDTLKIDVEVEETRTQLSLIILAFIGIIVVGVYMVINVIRNLDHYK